MKNKKIKLLTLGILSTIVISSTPVFASANNSNSIAVKTASSKIITTSSTSNLPTMPINIRPAFTYGQSDGPSAQSIINSGETIKTGDVGNAVKQVQTACNNWIHSVGGSADDYVKVDGVFGKSTRYAVTVFQDNVSCGPVDGEVGARTWAALSTHK